MSVELFPTGRDPLRRLGSMSLITGLLGLLAIVYVMVKYVQDRDSAPEWMLGVGTCLLFGAVAASLVHGVLLDHRSGALAVVLVLCDPIYRTGAGRPAYGADAPFPAGNERSVKPSVKTTSVLSQKSVHKPF